MKNITTKNKKTMIKNNIMISHFSTKTCLNMDKKLAGLKDERESLKNDLGLIGPAIKAASKISTGETPAQADNECLEELQENYAVFFDSEGEEENASSLLNKIMGVKRYLSKEIKANKKSINSLKENSKSEDYSSGYTSSSASTTASSSASSSASIKSSIDSKEFTIEKVESSKRKADDISDSEGSSASSSSKKSRQSSNEQENNWYYTPYNPFDDLGSD